MNSIARLIKDFEKVQKTYPDFGAHDTEPRDIFYLILEGAFAGTPFKNLCADEWELFSNKDGREIVANEMNEAAALVHQEILRLQEG